MKQWIKENLSIIILVTVLLLAGYLFLSCKSFKPKDYIVSGESSECNDFYMTMGFYSLVEKSDSAFIGTIYTECQNSRKEDRKLIREKHCKELFYGNDPLDKKQYEKYAQYLECQK